MRLPTLRQSIKSQTTTILHDRVVREQGGILKKLSAWMPRLRDLAVATCMLREKADLLPCGSKQAESWVDDISCALWEYEQVH